MGGLGNQMFQYAAGRALAIRHNTVLKLDMSFYQTNKEDETPRKFLLESMHINAERALPSELPHLEGNISFFQQIKGVYLKLSKKSCDTVLLDFENRINDQFFSSPDNTYLVGYWQSDKYFSSISELIRREFTPIRIPDAFNQELSIYMGKTNSVSIHIRRGDYIHNPETQAVHGICSLEYYQKCVETISGTIDNPEFFIFSDEPEWVKNNLDLDRPFTILSHNATDMPMWDLWLMSRCKHNIIANSSFSWWGAWLNDNPGKVVLAPKQWFADERLVTAVVPERWRRV